MTTDAISATRRSIRELVDGTLRVTFDVDPIYKADFLNLFPDIDMPAAIAPLKLDRDVSHGTHYGQYYKNLYLSSFLLEVVVLMQLGSDQDYREWIRDQKCIVCGRQDYIEETGEMKSEAAHVRRADTFGMAYKADFACVPLCHAHHTLQHNKGESAIGGVEFMDKNKNKFLRDWGWQQLHIKFNTDTMTAIDPEDFYQWAQNLEIDKYLP